MSNIEKMTFIKRYIGASNYKADKAALIKESVTNAHKKQKKLCLYNRNSLYQCIHSLYLDNNLISCYATAFVLK